MKIAKLYEISKLILVSILIGNPPSNILEVDLKKCPWGCKLQGLSTHSKTLQKTKMYLHFPEFPGNL